MDQFELLFAPLKGITTRTFRNAFANHFEGFNSMYAPFISSLGRKKIQPDKLADLLPVSNNLLETVPQVLSNDAKEIILLGKTLQEHGYTHLNWNLGCSFSRIIIKERGCGLLPYPEKLKRMLDEIFQEMPIKLSIKTRLGYRDPNEILKVMEILNQYPIHLVIIHARIGTQIYSGETDIKGFSECVKKSKIPIAFNGDIIHNTRFRELRQRFPEISSWMIGRGALIDPFLPLKTKGITLEDEEKRIRLQDFHQELVSEGRDSTANEIKLLNFLKAIWFYMAGLFQSPHSNFSAIKTTTTLEQYQNVIQKVFDQAFANDGQLEHFFKKGIKHKGDLKQSSPDVFLRN